MNRLRAIAVVCGAILLSAAMFGVVTYNTNLSVPLLVGALGIIVAVTPDGLSRTRRVLHRLRQEWRGANARAGEKDRYYVSHDSFVDRRATIERARDALVDTRNFGGVEEDDFPEGRGLLVRHGGFHGSFVRITGSGRIVLAGASSRTGELATQLGHALDVSFDRSWSNPMRRRHPLRGGARIVLALVLVVATVGGVVGIAATGYPSAAYNPAEKTVLASYDAKAAVLPGISKTDATIQKARFRVDALEESDTEVMWAKNGTRWIYVNGKHASMIAADVRESTTTLRGADLTPAQRSRLDAINADLRTAETSAAHALDERLSSSNVTRPDAVERFAESLRNHRPGV